MLGPRAVRLCPPNHFCRLSAVYPQPRVYPVASSRPFHNGANSVAGCSAVIRASGPSKMVESQLEIS